MKRFSGLLVTAVVILLALQTTGCTFQAPSPTATGVPTITASTPAQTIEQARQQLQETGLAIVDSRETASELAGYEVGIPAFIPQGFLAQGLSLGIFFVHDMNFPTPVRGLHNYPIVRQQFAQEKGPMPPTNKPWFQLTQSFDEIVGGEIPVDIGGYPGKKLLRPGDKDRNEPPSIELYWSGGSTFYQLSGYLISPLDEATLVNVAASVTAD